MSVECIESKEDSRIYAEIMILTLLSNLQFGD